MNLKIGRDSAVETATAVYRLNNGTEMSDYLFFSISVIVG